MIWTDANIQNIRSDSEVLHIIVSICQIEMGWSWSLGLEPNMKQVQSTAIKPDYVPMRLKAIAEPCVPWFILAWDCVWFGVIRLKTEGQLNSRLSKGCIQPSTNFFINSQEVLDAAFCIHL